MSLARQDTALLWFVMICLPLLVLQCNLSIAWASGNYRSRRVEALTAMSSKAPHKLHNTHSRCRIVQDMPRLSDLLPRDEASAMRPTTSRSQLFGLPQVTSACSLSTRSVFLCLILCAFLLFSVSGNYNL